MQNTREGGTYTSSNDGLQNAKRIRCFLQYNTNLSWQLMVHSQHHQLRQRPPPPSSASLPQPGLTAENHAAPETKQTLLLSDTGTNI